MKLYFDLCALKRPFDDRSQPRVDSEAIAVLHLLDQVIEEVHTLTWSDALTFENDEDPDHEVREIVDVCRLLAKFHKRVDGDISRRAIQLTGTGLSPLDAAHLALAEAGECQVLITCDDRFEKRAANLTSIRVMNPLQLVMELHDGPAT